eukprot:993425-Rhodomonas_salina.2
MAKSWKRDTQPTPRARKPDRTGSNEATRGHKSAERAGKLTSKDEGSSGSHVPEERGRGRAGLSKGFIQGESFKHDGAATMSVPLLIATCIRCRAALYCRGTVFCYQIFVADSKSGSASRTTAEAVERGVISYGPTAVRRMISLWISTVAQYLGSLRLDNNGNYQ